MTAAEHLVLDCIRRGLGSCAERLAGKTLLLTGAGGFLGRWIVRTVADLNLQQPPCRVLAIDSVRETSETIASELRGDADFIYSDLSIPLGISERIDYAIHAAGIASPYWYRRHPLATISAAVDGSRHVLQLLLAKQNRSSRYLFLSSSEVYQTATVVPTPETYIGAIPTLTDRSCYDSSKALGETLMHVYATHEDLQINAGAVRIFNSFGPLMREQDHRILPRIASAMKGGRELLVYGLSDLSRLPTRTYCPVADTVVGCLRALLLGASGRIYNIGVGAPELSVVDLCARIEQVTGRAVPIRLVDPPAVYTDEPQRRCPEIARARAELGYEPLMALNDGLGAFFNWALDTYTGQEAT